MAVVFISPQRRQKVFIWIIVAIMFLSAILFAVLIFLSRPPNFSSMMFDKNEVVLDTKIFESEEFKRLEVFPKLAGRFAYFAQDRNKKEVAGFVNASSQEDALGVLISQGFTLITIQDTVSQGRSNPFVPY